MKPVTALLALIVLLSPIIAAFGLALATLAIVIVVVVGVQLGLIALHERIADHFGRITNRRIRQMSREGRVLLFGATAQR